MDMTRKLEQLLAAVRDARAVAPDNEPRLAGALADLEEEARDALAEAELVEGTGFVSDGPEDYGDEPELRKRARRKEDEDASR